jgi:hypothetical protein
MYIQRSKQNDAGHDHIYILQSMDSPDAPRIKEVESFAAGRIPPDRNAPSMKKVCQFIIIIQFRY